MSDEMIVSDVMTADPVTVLPTDNLAHVYELMNGRSIRHLPVVNGDGELVGLISHRDLVRVALFAFDDLPFTEQKTFLAETAAHEAMTTDPDTVEPGTPVAEAARLLFENKFGCLPVVEGTRLVGILTEADFVKLASIDSASFEPRAHGSAEGEPVDL